MAGTKTQPTFNARTEDLRVALGHKDISTTIGYLGGGDKEQRRANIERSFPQKIGVVA